MFTHNTEVKFDDFLVPHLKCNGFIFLGKAISSNYILIGRGALSSIIIFQEEKALSLNGRSAITVQSEKTGAEISL